MYKEKPKYFLRHIGSEENHKRIPYFKIDSNNEYSEVMKHLSNEIITYNTNK